MTNYGQTAFLKQILSSAMRLSDDLREGWKKNPPNFGLFYLKNNLKG